MKHWEREVLSEIFPVHADLQPILRHLRKRYGVPEFNLSDGEFAELLPAKKECPWEDIQLDIRV